MTVTWLVAIVAIILGIIVIAAVRRDDPWQSAARALDLKLARSVPDLLPRLEGMINGLPVRIEIAAEHGPGVHYTVFYPPLGMALKLQRETTITRALGQVGETDAQIGARAFDDSFRVNTSRPDALRDMMTSELRRTLVRTIEHYPQIVITDGEMKLASETTQPTTEELTTTITEIASAAKLLVSRRPAPLEKPAPRQAPKPKTQPPRRPAEPARPQGPQATPDRASPRVNVGSSPPTPPSQDLPTKPTPESTGLPDGFFDDVFGANRLSFESSGSFDKQIRGTKVTLAGTVKQAREETDVTTGQTTTKATITIAQIDNDLYGQTDIDAVVLLPAEAASRLERGSEVSFEGIIEGVDAFMRNLFIEKAKLT